VPTTPRRASTARTPTTRKRCVALEATAEYYYMKRTNETHAEGLAGEGIAPKTLGQRLLRVLQGRGPRRVLQGTEPL
jgi:hypothetical protein